MPEIQMSWLVISVFTGFLGAVLAPVMYRRAKHAAAPILSILPLAVFAQLCTALPGIAAGEVWHIDLPWVPSLGLSLSFTLDGLGLVMSLLISGIGALVLLYGNAYLHDHPQLGRFFGLLLIFMTAMLGVVLSANMLLLFVFWELTSISSFFLIGFEHDRANARAAAWQALLVTGAGGLAMLAGFILLASITGSFEIGVWIASSTRILAHPLAPAAFLLILAGAGTKSAQFPFHFWLPNAMEAPAPVSAFLHSATMVKAGIYLLARLYPVLGGLALWTPLLGAIGLLTCLGAALLALGQSDMKRLLAYTTVSALGALTLLLGLSSPLAVKTAVVFLVTHALYKGALFLAAGSVDHGTGTRDINLLGGAGRKMPFTALTAGLAALSMAGLPALLGFVAKELIYETTLNSAWPAGLTLAMVIANAVMVVVAVWVGFQPFWGPAGRKDLHPHEGPSGLWLPPLILAGLGFLLGIFPALTGTWLVGGAMQAILQQPYPVKLALWHGFTPMLGLSALTLLAGIGLASLRSRLQARMASLWHGLSPVGPAAMYPRALHAVLSFASWQTRRLQSGYLRVYVLMIVLFTLLLTGFTFWVKNIPICLTAWVPPRIYDLVLIAIILSAAFLVTRARSRLATIALLGSIGFTIAIIFLLYSAPDLAMVQFAIETLTVILFVLVLYRLPKFKQFSSRAVRTADAVVAISAGVLMTVLMLLVSAHSPGSNLSSYYVENSLPLANGRNIVNVILVDFRGFDTLGEITVLAIAAAGVFSLVKLAVRHERKPAATAKKGEEG